MAFGVPSDDELTWSSYFVDLNHATEAAREEVRTLIAAALNRAKENLEKYPESKYWRGQFDALANLESKIK